MDRATLCLVAEATGGVVLVEYGLHCRVIFSYQEKTTWREGRGGGRE